MGDSYRPGVGGGLRRRGDLTDTYTEQYRDSGYTFRGAAVDSYRPQEHDRREDFSFRSQQPAKHFPQQLSNHRPQRQSRDNQGRKRGAPYKSRGPGGQSFRRFGRAAHERDLLKRANRETTPEQLAGMNADKSQKYAEIISDSSDDESDSTEDSDDDAHRVSRKRVKTSEDEETAVPKWSNPDPYSVLPPTDMGIGPKKDIVQVIRKSKLDAAAAASTSTNAVKENADFISFDFGDDNEMSDDDDQGDDGIMINDGVGSLPPAPPGFVMPSDAEFMDSYASAPKGSKRKRGLEPSHLPDDVVDSWRVIPGSNPTPWLRKDQGFVSNVAMQLHMEILDFYEYIRPHRHEGEIRNDVIDRIEHVVRRFQPGKKVEIQSFGSFACGLYLPTADMDLVAISDRFKNHGIASIASKNFMFSLSSHLNQRGISRQGTMVVVHKAKVPIIKFVDDLTGIKVDVSFENDSGLYANRTFRDWKEQFPEMPPLVVLIKQLLAMRDLNEVHTGGIGGFTTICLVVSMLQLMPKDQLEGGDPKARFANLLMHFLDLYGNKFNVRTTGITMDPPGHFDKKRTQVSARMNPDGLTIIDPNRTENDISGGSKRIGAVFGFFRRAHAALQRRAEQFVNGTANSGSILECILGGNYTSFDDARDRLYRLESNARGSAYHHRSPSPVRDAYQSSHHSYQQPPPPARDYYDSFHSQGQYPQPADWWNIPPPTPTQSYQSYQPPASANAPSYGALPSATLPPSHYSLPPHSPAGQSAAPPSQYQPINEPSVGKKKRTKSQKKQKKAQKIAQNESAAPSQKKAKKSKSEKKVGKKNKGAKATNKKT